MFLFTHRLEPSRNPCIVVHSEPADTQYPAAWRRTAAAEMDAGRCDWCELLTHSDTTVARPLGRCNHSTRLRIQTGNKGQMMTTYVSEMVLQSPLKSHTKRQFCCAYSLIQKSGRKRKCRGLKHFRTQLLGFRRRVNGKFSVYGCIF